MILFRSMYDGGYLNQFLYLLVYSASIISAAAAVVFRKRLTAGADIQLSRIIISIAFCSTMLSIQVFLNAIGVLELLDENNTSGVIITLNIMIFSGIAALVYSIISISLHLRPARFTKQLKQISLILIASILVNAVILQILTLFSHSISAIELLGVLMLSGITLFAAATAFSAIRLFVPLKQAEDPKILPTFRIFLSCLFLFPAFLLISGSLVGAVLAPAGYIGLNILILRILYIRLSESKDKEEKVAGTGIYNPAVVCRELGLSKRETEVALLLSEGRSYKEIAAKLFISMSTTQTHVGRIYSKLGINNKTELTGLLYYKKNSHTT